MLFSFLHISYESSFGTLCEKGNNGKKRMLWRCANMQNWNGQRKKGEIYLFMLFCAVIRFRDISVVLWYAKQWEWYVCQTYLTCFIFHLRHNIFGMLCGRFAPVKAMAISTAQYCSICIWKHFRCIFLTRKVGVGCLPIPFEVGGNLLWPQILSHHCCVVCSMCGP